MSEKGMLDFARVEFLPKLKSITLKPREHCFANIGLHFVHVLTLCIMLFAS
jgi:hypothetical protein